MRLTPLAAAAALGIAVTALAVTPAVVQAQSKQAEDDARRKAEAEAADKKKKKEKEWNTAQAPLPGVKNAGPCPYVKVLYDASRYVELKDGKESPSEAGFTGEIQNVQSDCAYKGTDPHQTCRCRSTSSSAADRRRRARTSATTTGWR